ncbi:MAG: DUF4115 domain-containing protein [Alphaproteobacteria bacterium]|nr:DUF4115 domain-containing protein [Alphaproteobacteria bacterium]
MLESDIVQKRDGHIHIDSVGLFLRDAREIKKYTLRDISNSLRIRLEHLQAIEAGHYETLPGPTYAIGFVRSYAKFLELDSENLVERFKEESKSSEASPELEFPTPTASGWFPKGKVIIICAILSSFTFVFWFLLQTENSSELLGVPDIADSISAADIGNDGPMSENIRLKNNPDPTTKTLIQSFNDSKNEKNKVDQTNVKAQSKSNASVKLTKKDTIVSNTKLGIEKNDSLSGDSSGAPKPIIANNEETIDIKLSNLNTTNDHKKGKIYGDLNSDVRIIISATEDSWVQVIDQDKIVLLTRMLHKGDRYFVPNRSDLIMLTGNAGGLSISVDGSLVPTIGDKGEILHNVSLNTDLLKAGRVARP